MVISVFILAEDGFGISVQLKEFELVMFCEDLILWKGLYGLGSVFHGNAYSSIKGKMYVHL